MSHPLPKTPFQDRPGWIPSHLTTHWDPDPYAYQTEEESMPAGGAHNHLLARLMQLLENTLEEQHLMLLLDPFMLYRDAAGIKQRIAPDLLLTHWRKLALYAYDLDVKKPPRFIAEITSSKNPLKKLEDRLPLYTDMGVQSYLIIDAETSTGQLHNPIQLYLWQMMDGQVVKLAPDSAGRLTLPELGVSVSVWGRRFRFVDLKTGEVLLDSKELKQARQADAHQIEAEAHRAKAEAQRADVAEAELARLKAFLAEKGYPIP